MLLEGEQKEDGSDLNGLRCNGHTDVVFESAPNGPTHGEVPEQLQPSYNPDGRWVTWLPSRLIRPYLLAL